MASRLSKDYLFELQDRAIRGVPILFDEARRLFQFTNNQDLKNLLSIARDVTNKRHGKHINFYYTSKHFPAVSITSACCDLNCRHCRRKLLEGLTPATSPEKFVNLCEKLSSSGAKGVLITGGCLSNGKVPIARFLDAIDKVKKRTNLILIAHTGLMNFNEARRLVDAKLDGVALDVVGSPETTKAIYGIEINPDDYVDSLKALAKAGMPIISPHVCVGLHFGKLKGELESLKIISSIRPTTVVITALMPLRGTPLENVKPSPNDVAKVIAMAKLIFPDVPLALGCARSKGTDRELIDELAIHAGITNIAIPTKKAIEAALSLKMEMQSYAACCAIPSMPSLKLPLSEGHD